uniref:NADH-ubiquinone oxidoreductase chain 2 n=1 Tax=Vietnamella dabieshanensis TaxID=756260 RepID=X1W3F2_9INSE|nr:NADH dehydrogenase subunit 2 [Vietnamella dabieshanensis]
MFYHPSQILFFIILLSGSLISISSSSWFGAWLGLELNLLTFIPLMINKSPYSSEAALKYFLTQAMASIFLFFMATLYSLLMKMFLFMPSAFIEMKILFSTALLIKMGAAPFHFWFPGVVEGLTWPLCFILMTWQKLAPIALISYTFSNFIFAFLVIISCSLIGAFGGLNQTSLRKIMAYSSINHIGWILAGLLISNFLWISYYIFYILLSLPIIMNFYYLQLNYFSQLFSLSDNNNFNNIFMFSNFLSLGGLPPFLGFLPKWAVIQALTMNNYISLAVIMVSLTLIVLFFYSRIFFTTALLKQSNPKWLPSVSSWTSLNWWFSMFSIFGLPFLSVFYFLT